MGREMGSGADSVAAGAEGEDSGGEAGVGVEALGEGLVTVHLTEGMVAGAEAGAGFEEGSIEEGEGEALREEARPVEVGLDHETRGMGAGAEDRLDLVGSGGIPTSAAGTGELHCLGLVLSF